MEANNQFNQNLNPHRNLDYVKRKMPKVQIVDYELEKVYIFEWQINKLDL